MTTLAASQFEAVYVQYVDQARPGKKKFIQDIESQCRDVTIADLQNTTHRLIYDVSKRKLRTLQMKYLAPVVTVLKSYSHAVDPMIAHYPTLFALVWGGFRCVIETLQRYEGTLESVQPVLNLLEQHIWALQSFDKIYGSAIKSPTIQTLIARSCTDIFDLWYRIFKEFNRSQMNFDNTFKGNKKFEKALSAIREDADLLGRIHDNVERELQHQSRQIMERAAAQLDLEVSNQLLQERSELDSGYGTASSAVTKTSAGKQAMSVFEEDEEGDLSSQYTSLIQWSLKDYPAYHRAVVNSILDGIGKDEQVLHAFRDDKPVVERLLTEFAVRLGREVQSKRGEMPCVGSTSMQREYKTPAPAPRLPTFYTYKSDDGQC